ncbi:MAG: nickel pincer cofactor biosynthesis protein LarC [Isosphaeraceae bacterium]|nr:nickel pincer cofactor biosynthesis protein LarC [Isosphaeraceae bacterium]
MRIGYFDCFSGISGDMTLGALVDAGVEARAIQEAVASLDVPCELTFETVRRGGFRATYARVQAPHEHAHRHLHHIEALIDKSRLTPRQNELAKRIFRRLGEAEAAVHGIDLKRIHFHEVGAVDSIVDIVGAAVGLDLLGVERFEASPVPPGRGSVKAAHGRMPLPAPGTAELLKGVPLADSAVEMELTTPTGAAILTTIAERFGPLPAMTIETIGLGAGTREIPDQANIVRLFVGTMALPAESDRIWVLETNLDDLPGEVVGYTTTQLLAAGALDAFIIPIYMKKNRPGVMLSVLCNEPQIPAMEEILFRETTTLGVRRYPVSRHKLKRQATEVATLFGPIRGKLGWIEGRPPTFSPEYDDCARVALAQGLPLREVYEAAHAAYAEATQPQTTADPV